MTGQGIRGCPTTYVERGERSGGHEIDGVFFSPRLQPWGDVGGVEVGPATPFGKCPCVVCEDLSMTKVGPVHNRGNGGPQTLTSHLNYEVTYKLITETPVSLN